MVMLVNPGGVYVYKYNYSIYTYDSYLSVYVLCVVYQATTR